MIKLNFIPEAQRVRRASLGGEDLGGLPAEMIVGGVVALLGSLLMVHVVLAACAATEMAQYKLLEVRWDGMAASRKSYDELTNEVKRLQLRMNSVKPITQAQKLHWPRLLNEISDSVPGGIWLRELSFDKGALIINGSAVSVMKTEMADVGNFVAALKDKPSVKENFTPIEIDSIQGRDNVAASIADFSLKAKLK